MCKRRVRFILRVCLASGQTRRSMDSETESTHEPQGMSQLAKDRIDVASKGIAIVGGIISAVALIITLQGGTAQRSQEHRWNQAKLAMDLVSGMLSDPQAFDALRM